MLNQYSSVALSISPLGIPAYPSRLMLRADA